MILGDVCMDFEPYFKVHNLVSVHPKSVILGQMTNLKMVFYMVVSVYRLVKILEVAPVPWWISERLIAELQACRRPGSNFLVNFISKTSDEPKTIIPPAARNAGP